jgi:hypothetical protein
MKTRWLCLGLLMALTVPAFCGATPESDNHYDELGPLLAEADTALIYLDWWNWEMHEGMLDREPDFVFTSASEISELARAFTNRGDYFAQCGYDGGIRFLKDGVDIVPSMIRFNVDCNQAVYHWNDSQCVSVLSPSGSVLLGELREAFAGRTDDG